MNYENYKLKYFLENFQSAGQIIVNHSRDAASCFNSCAVGECQIN